MKAHKSALKHGISDKDGIYAAEHHVYTAGLDDDNEPVPPDRRTPTQRPSIRGSQKVREPREDSPSRPGRTSRTDYPRSQKTHRQRSRIDTPNATSMQRISASVRSVSVDLNTKGVSQVHIDADAEIPDDQIQAAIAAEGIFTVAR